MPIKTYNKLVRDRVTEIIEKDGSVPIFKKIDNNKDIAKLLSRKLLEESQELNERMNDLEILQKDPEYFNDKEVMKEIADIMEVYEELIFTLSLSGNLDKISKQRKLKADSKGRFKEGYYLYSVHEK